VDDVRVTPTSEPIDEATVLAMRAILDMVDIIIRADGDDAPAALAAWAIVHGSDEVRLRVHPDGSVDTTAIATLVRRYLAAGCHTVHLLLAYLEGRFGVPAAELLDGFERDLLGADEP
jgi:hypothetical protein